MVLFSMKEKPHQKPNSVLQSSEPYSRGRQKHIHTLAPQPPHHISLHRSPLPPPWTHTHTHTKRIHMHRCI